MKLEVNQDLDEMEKALDKINKLYRKIKYEIHLANNDEIDRMSIEEFIIILDDLGINESIEKLYARLGYRYTKDQFDIEMMNLLISGEYLEVKNKVYPIHSNNLIDEK